MAVINPRRMTANIEGDFVVFMIGMRINKFWKFHKWVPVALAMPRMQKEIAAQPEIGCLGSMQGITFLVQYWRSFEHLETYARNRDKEHLPAWAEFNKRMKDSAGDVGIWHETYLVRAGEYETLYNNMPLMGLAKASSLVPVAGARETAKGRLREGSGS